MSIESQDRPIYMRTIALLCYASDRLTQVIETDQAYEQNVPGAGSGVQLRKVEA